MPSDSFVYKLKKKTEIGWKKEGLQPHYSKQNVYRTIITTQLNKMSK